ncbi:hypothetical protein AB0E25_26460 [Streptomyces bobili]|uniref:hypothetical protein n=1 Tax=Streptomyces bobili TaxID=67280 RepID=UPI0033F3F0F9
MTISLNNSRLHSTTHFIPRQLTSSLDPAQWAFLFFRAGTIYGGSNEIQRGIIAGRVVGLPKGA